MVKVGIMFCEFKFEFNRFLYNLRGEKNFIRNGSLVRTNMGTFWAYTAIFMDKTNSMKELEYLLQGSDGDKNLSQHLSHFYSETGTDTDTLLKFTQENSIPWKLFTSDTCLVNRYVQKKKLLENKTIKDVKKWLTKKYKKPKKQKK